MPVAYAGVAAAAISAGTSIYGAVNSGGPGANAFGSGGYQPYQLTSLPAADSLYAGGFAPMNAWANDIVNNPYATSQQGFADAASAYGTGTLAPQEQAASGQMFNLGNAGAPYAAQILQTGFDPQNALYNRTQQQITDQLNAQNATAGLSGTPYGAGVAGQGISNFNIDWQNQQLQRQATALQGYGQGVSGVGRAYSGGAALGTQGTDALNTYGSLPYNTYLGNLDNRVSATQAEGAYAQPYLGLGNSYNQTGLSANNAAFNQQQQQIANLGSGVQGLGNLFGGSSGGGSNSGLFGSNISSGGLFSGGGSGSGIGPTYLPSDPYAGMTGLY